MGEFGKNFGGRTFPRAMADPPPKYSAIFFIDIMLARQVQRKRVPELGSAEPEGALVLSCPS